MGDDSKNSQKTLRADGGVIPSGVGSQDNTLKDPSSIIPAWVDIFIPPGSNIVLNYKTYKILRKITRPGESGEADVYLIENEVQKYVLKCYHHPSFKPKDETLKELKGITHKNIITLIDYGYYDYGYERRFFEILEYAEGGSILDQTLDGNYRYIPIKDIKRLKEIVKEVVNALEFCHSKRIIHRDIKPQNIFFSKPNGTDLKIGDFGISSVLDEGLSKRLTSRERTEIYAAPELYQGTGEKTILSKEVDYYALGITLIHIFSGEEPFNGLSPFEIMNIKCDGKVDIPDDAPDELKTLIKGLITVDPKKRWGYDEVQKWLNGEYVPVYYKTGGVRYSDFHFGVIDGEEIVVNDPAELARLMEKYPEKGKKHLYKGTIAKWLEGVNQSL